jgi:hypothetical protein
MDALRLASDFLSQLITISGALLAFSLPFAATYLPRPGEMKSRGRGLLYAAWGAYVATIAFGLLTRWFITRAVAGGKRPEDILNDRWMVELGLHWLTPLAFATAVFCSLWISIVYLRSPDDNSLWKR